MSTISSSTGVFSYNPAPGTRPTDGFAGRTAEQRAALSPDEVASIGANDKLSAYLNQAELARLSGAPGPTEPAPVPHVAVRLTSAQVTEKFGTTNVLYSRSTITAADAQAVLKPTNVENHDAQLGDVQSMTPDRLNNMIGLITSEIKSNGFKGMNVYGENGKESTTSADVFLGWLKAAAAGGSAEPGTIVSKSA